MENEKTEEKMEGVSEDKEENTEEAKLEIVQLQGLMAELHEGLHAALMELRELRHRDHGLEEKLQAHQTDVDDKIMGLKNSLNTFKEALNTALLHVKDVSSRQREVQRRIELLQPENTKDIICVSCRKSCKADVLMESGDEHICVPSQSDISGFQHLFANLPRSGSPQRSSTSTQTSTSEQEAQQQRRGRLSTSPAQRERNNSKDDTDTSSRPENSKRQRAALELLESERVYISNLSLLLKANISFNGSEAPTSKDKRPFPSSLRFLIQQHLNLLHILQERVLKYQWQGIMGDVFMRLTSKGSEFLDFYVSYLKELPDCLSVITMLACSSVKSSALQESDITGDESKPSLHMLLLQPVQRIPEYLLLLQRLLRQTDVSHPDYYLLLVCIQQFRSFTAQYHHLLQHNQELLLHNHKELKREHANQARDSKQRLLEQIQSHCFQDRDQESETHGYDREWTSQLPFFSHDLDSRSYKPTGLGSIPESEASESLMSYHHCLPSRPTDLIQGQPGSALADALGEFLLPPDPEGMESHYEEDKGSLHDVSMFERCSSASSDSSIDIAFVKCPKAHSASHHVMAANVSTACEVLANDGNQGNGYSKLSNRGCVSPDEALMMRFNQHHPLQASQCKSKSLNGLQMENTVSCLESGPLSDHLRRVGLGSHAKLQRQGSKGSKGCPHLSHKVHSPLGNRADTDKQNDGLHGSLSIDGGIKSWGEESKWRSGAEENNHNPLSERSRKQDKGGFRSSFKKLFKKKSGDEKKEKGCEKAPENHNNSEHQETSGKNPKLAHLEINRGTAV
uniref:DH domain-containing protein n=1 Tax=Monopterus albus TaxID=43700 RepID=A0A3Q3K9H1_MONAL|nr:rho guanine nucleotide exchange factor 33 [Monopterus albus]